jgi:hypothetical protein
MIQWNALGARRGANRNEQPLLERTPKSIAIRRPCRES